VQNLAAAHIDVALLVSLPNDDRSADASQASDLNDVLQFEMLDFPSKTNDLLLSHTERAASSCLSANRGKTIASQIIFSRAASASWRRSLLRFSQVSDLLSLSPFLD
jgi:hypothetical protein